MGWPWLIADAGILLDQCVNDPCFLQFERATGQSVEIKDCSFGALLISFKELNKKLLTTFESSPVWESKRVFPTVRHYIRVSQGSNRAPKLVLVTHIEGMGLGKRPTDS